MNSQFYVINIDGRFIGNHLFVNTPKEGDVFIVGREIVEIVEVRHSIGVVLAEVA